LAKKIEKIMIETIISLIISFFITYLTIPLILILSKRYTDLLKIPNLIASHSKAVPTYGGVAIFFGIILSFFVLLKIGDVDGVQWIMGSVFIIFFLGVIDDSITLRPSKKFLGQLIAITIIVYFNDLRITSMQGLFFIHELSYIPSFLLTVLTMLIITNAYNLIDGIDGLAALIGLLVSVVFFVFFFVQAEYNFTVIIASIIGGLAAFLRYNWHPAKIFMGDTGSLVIGFLLSVIAIVFIEKDFRIESEWIQIKTSTLAIAILIVPLQDLLRVFIVRLLQKKSPFSGDRNHLHHLLIDKGLSQIQTSFTLIAFNIVVIIAALFFAFLNINYVLLLICSLGVLFLVIINKSK
jgi:UDP-N-acetylmuramyl pentapeptide phosphotransferase/UDP-N-acetylglucosamine-1-phosphate transferase